MKKVTKFVALFLALTLCVSMLAACGESGSASTAATSKTETKSEAPAAAKSEAPTAAKSEAPAAPANSGETYSFSLTFHDSAEAVKTKYVQQWADDVREATNGQVDITVFAGGTLASGPDALDAVKQGTADIGVCFTGFFPGQFPLAGVVELPMTGIFNAEQGTNVLWDLYEATPEFQAELDNFQVIMMYTNPNNCIGTSKPVHVADDMKGLKLRVPAGTCADMATAWGATPMTITSAEIYQSMEKDVIQGYIIDPTGVNAWSLYEVTDYYTWMPFCVSPWLVLMNKDSWNKLPADLQEIVLSCSDRERSLGMSAISEEEAAETFEKAKNDYNAEVIEPTEEEYATFQAAAENYRAQWVEAQSANGFDAQAFVDKCLELADKYQK